MNSIKNEVQFSKNSLTLENVELSKGYKKLFSNFNLKFKYGKIYLVVGSNGIGKTTLLKCICGLTIPDSGDIFWNNSPIKSNLKDFANDVYFLGHSNSLHPGLSIFENINYLSLLKNSRTQFKNKNDEFGILRLNDIRVPELSNGQKRRVALSILSNCEKPLWILDEPLNSVDKNYKKIFMNMIQNHSKRNGISIISSHEVNDYSLDENVIIIDLNKI